MKKFAFLVHLRNNYKEDLSVLHPAFGAMPEKFYRLLFRSRPFSPFIWSEVKITPGSTEAEGYIIMLPYVAGQLLNQQKSMMPVIKKALKMAANRGAGIVGLGALTSPITSGGKLLIDNPFTSITNGNAFTAVITYRKAAELITDFERKPIVAIVGATGSVGSLVSQLLVKKSLNADYLLVARDEHRLTELSSILRTISPSASVKTSRNLLDIACADIVILLTSASDFLLKTGHLKKNAIILDDTQPRNTHPDLLKERHDIRIIDGGLVSIPGLQFERHIGLPSGLSYACLAETILLSLADHEGHFSIGNPTLQQAEYIEELAQNYSHLGFELAVDHSFGKVLV